MFNESDVVYTSEDIRFTVKGDDLYTTVLAWPGEKCTIRTFSGDYRNNPLYKNEIKQISMLGDNKPLKWSFEKAGLVIETPKNKPCEHAFVFKITRHYK